MLILGIDPGLARTGFGLIKLKKNLLKAIDYGCITTGLKTRRPDRLKKIYQAIKKIIKKNKPELIVIEELFFAQNAKTALKVGEARGVIILACAETKARLIEMTPLQVKVYLTAYGRASKKQIQQMVRLKLNLKETPKPDDTADALALAICGAKISQFNSTKVFETRSRNSLTNRHLRTRS